MSECYCLRQSRGDLHWEGGFQELSHAVQAYGEYSFRVTQLRCTACDLRYEVLADDTPAHRVIYQWTANPTR